MTCPYCGSATAEVFTCPDPKCKRKGRPSCGLTSNEDPCNQCQERVASESRVGMLAGITAEPVQP
jgi:hypothetical protein